MTTRYDEIDEIEEIQKFNPYHDARGRFSSANGAHSFSATPGKSRAHDLAIERELQRFSSGAGSVAVQGPKKPKVPNLSYERLPLSTIWGKNATAEDKKKKRETIKRFISEAKVGNVYATGAGPGSAREEFEIVYHGKSPNKMGIKSGNHNAVALNSANATIYLVNGARLVRQKKE